MTNLRFHFHGAQNTLFKDLTEDQVKNIFAVLNDSRVESFQVGQQWINKYGIITVYPEVDSVVQEIPAEPAAGESSMPQPDSAA